MLIKVYSAAVVGIEGEIVEVEVDVLSGLPATIVVGLPDTAVKESRERVKSAIKHSEGIFPASRVAINLAPADLPKNGSIYDLPIAISILINSGQLASDPKDMVIVGELALDGAVRSVPGVLPIAVSAKSRGYRSIMVPRVNAEEAALVKGLSVIPVGSLKEAVGHLQGLQLIEPHRGRELSELVVESRGSINLRDVKGQEQAKRALEIAAAGAHNLLKLYS